MAHPRVGGEPLKLYYKWLIEDGNVEPLAHSRVGGGVKCRGPFTP